MFNPADLRSVHVFIVFLDLSHVVQAAVDSHLCQLAKDKVCN